MELEDLKSKWKTIKTISKEETALLLMLQENRHPVLKKIRRQIQIEVSAWIVFLLVYFSMFDGDKKPFWVNCILIFSFLLPILHSLYGYFYNKYVTDGSNVKEALELLYNRLKKYAFIAVFSRVALMSGFLLFFTYSIDFTISKFLILLFLGIVFSFQLFVLFRLWKKRLKQIYQDIQMISEAE